MLSSLTTRNSSSDNFSHALNHTANLSINNASPSNADLTTLNRELEGHFKETLKEGLNIESSQLDSKSILAKIGDAPSSSDLAKLAAVRAKEYIDECLFGRGGVGTVVDINTRGKVFSSTPSPIFRSGNVWERGRFQMCMR
ncbi:hypothetical protein ACHAXR_006887 [Thalassiosira sp. AJA248-18]